LRDLRQELDRAQPESVRAEMNDYRIPVTARRMIKSAKAAMANNDAASSRNSLEVAEAFRAFRLASSRITTNIPATASKVGQSGLSWLTISSLRKMRSLIAPLRMIVAFPS